MAIVYPSWNGPTNVQQSILGNFYGSYDAAKQRRDEEQGIAAFGQYLDSAQQPMARNGLSALQPANYAFGAVERAPLAPVRDNASDRVAAANAVSGNGLPSVGDMTAYIVQSARQRGIDPGVAIKVARSEGLGPGIWQSNFEKNGRREPSYGPFQLLVGGGDTGYPEGLGNSFMQQTGLDPSDPKNWRQAVDFALDTASKSGWGQWYGAKRVGIGNMQGIGGAPAQVAPQQAVQVADASGGVPQNPQMQQLPQMPQDQSLFPPRDVMMALFRSPETRPLAIQLAQAAQGLRANQADPMAQLQYQKAVLELQQMANPQPKQTDDIREYEFARQQGYGGTFQQFMTDMKKAGATTVNVGGGAPGLGKLSTDFGYVMDPQSGQPVIDPQTGLPTAAAIPGSPAALEAQNVERAAQANQEMKARGGNVVLEDINRAKQIIDNGGFLNGTGLTGRFMQGVPGTDAFALGKLLETVKANAGFDKLQQMREASPTGGALGQVSERELTYLQAAIGNLDQSQSADDLKYNLDRVYRIYDEIINGPAPTGAKRRAKELPDGVSEDDIEYTMRKHGLTREQVLERLNAR